MGRWRASVLLNQIVGGFRNDSLRLTAFTFPLNRLQISHPSIPTTTHLCRFGSFAAIPSPSDMDINVSAYDSHGFNHKHRSKNVEDEELGKIPVKAYFLGTSINLRRMQSENIINFVPPISRSSNYIALQFCDFHFKIHGLKDENKVSCSRFMVVFQYGSAVLFNIEDNEVEIYLNMVRRHASGLLGEMRKDEYSVKEMPLLVEDMCGGPDHIVLKNLDMDSIRIIGSVLGQSIALDYFVSQVDGIVEEFTDINRGMEKSGTFTMDRKKLFQLVGRANSNMADVILRVGLFDRSEIAWREAKYAQIFEYLREEFEVTQRFGNLDFKLKFVEHNIHFLDRKSVV